MDDDEVISECILDVMRENVDEDINIKTIRNLTSEKLGVDLSSRKAWVRNVVHGLISTHFAEGGEEDEDDGSGVYVCDEGEGCVEVAEGEINKKEIRGAEDPPVPSKARDLPSIVVNKKDAEHRVDGSVPLRTTKQALRGSGLIVQLDDADLDFQNDTGVIGRVSVQSRRLTMDLKGQQYFASFRPCSTLMVIQTTGSLPERQAKAEMICDEFVELSGKKSMMRQMSGILIKGKIKSSERGSREMSEGNTEPPSKAAKRERAI